MCGPRITVTPGHASVELTRTSASPTDRRPMLGVVRPRSPRVPVAPLHHPLYCAGHQSECGGRGNPAAARLGGRAYDTTPHAGPHDRSDRARGGAAADAGVPAARADASAACRPRPASVAHASGAVRSFRAMGFPLHGPGQSWLPRLGTRRAPAVIHLGIAPPLGDNACETLFTPQPFEHDPPLLLGGEPSPGRPTNIVNTRLRSPGGVCRDAPAVAPCRPRITVYATGHIAVPSLPHIHLPVAPTRANVDGRRLLAAATKEGPSPMTPHKTVSTTPPR